MAKPRINVHITREVWKQLDEMTTRPGVSKASIVDAALAAFLSPEADDRRDVAIIRRIDRVERHLTVTAETLALFIRYYLTITLPLPEQDQQAAQALGRERFGYFIEQPAKRLASGKGLVAEVLLNTDSNDENFVHSAPFCGTGE